jgi:hypothetical protein
MVCSSVKRDKLLNRIDSVGFLHPVFQDQISELLLSIRQQQMPFIIYETYRTPARQKALISSNFSKLKDPMMSKHVHGLAVDFLIDYRAIRTLKKSKLFKYTSGNINETDDQYSQEHGPVYNLGVNAVGDSIVRPRTVVEDQVVLDFWNNLGLLLERQYPDLVWGGLFNIQPGQLIGSDPPHIEYKYADKLIREKKTIPALKARGNPGLEEIK